jgi:DNA-directed RNA polymerase specialized sigma24 family protein
MNKNLNIKSLVDKKEELNQTIQLLYNVKPHPLEDYKPYRSLLAFINRNIKQYNLNCDADVIVSEAYLRGLKFLDSGQEIRNPTAWLRKTAHNVIRELSREQLKEQPMESELISERLASKSDLIPDEIDDAALTVMRLSFQQLRLSERQILTLRFLYNLSWKDVVEEARTRGESMTSEVARQRGKRALKHLKKIFETLKSG